MKLTTKIKKASDGWFDLEVAELPHLEAQARNVEEIPRAVIAAAAGLTGRPENDFDVEVIY